MEDITYTQYLATRTLQKYSLRNSERGAESIPLKNSNLPYNLYKKYKTVSSRKTTKEMLKDLADNVNKKQQDERMAKVKDQIDKMINSNEKTTKKQLKKTLSQTLFFQKNQSIDLFQNKIKQIQGSNNKEYFLQRDEAGHKSQKIQQDDAIRLILSARLNDHIIKSTQKSYDAKLIKSAIQTYRKKDNSSNIEELLQAVKMYITKEEIQQIDLNQLKSIIFSSNLTAASVLGLKMKKNKMERTRTFKQYKGIFTGNSSDQANMIYTQQEKIEMVENFKKDEMIRIERNMFDKLKENKFIRKLEQNQEQANKVIPEEEFLNENDQIALQIRKSRQPKRLAQIVFKKVIESNLKNKDNSETKKLNSFRFSSQNSSFSKSNAANSKKSLQILTNDNYTEETKFQQQQQQSPSKFFKIQQKSLTKSISIKDNINTLQSSAINTPNSNKHGKHSHRHAYTTLYSPASHIQSPQQYQNVVNISQLKYKLNEFLKECDNTGKIQQANTLQLNEQYNIYENDINNILTKKINSSRIDEQQQVNNINNRDQIQYRTKVTFKRTLVDQLLTNVREDQVKPILQIFKSKMKEDKNIHLKLKINVKKY